MSNDEKLQRLSELEIEINRLQAERQEAENTMQLPNHLKMQFMEQADLAIEDLEIELQELLTENPFLLEGLQQSNQSPGRDVDGEDYDGEMLDEEQDKAFKEK